MSTIKDVASAAGVSISTVSIVLNGMSAERKIPQPTQDKVLEAVRAVNYQPNLSARKLRSSNKLEYTLGVFWAADTRIIVLTRVLEALQKAVQQSLCRINLVVCPFTAGRLRDERSLQGLSSFNAALLATISRDDLDYIEQTPPLLPIVLYNRQSDRFSSVGTDNRAAGRLAALQLLDKGITDIGMVTQEHQFLALGIRSRSFCEACEEYGIAGLASKTVKTEDTITGGYAAGKEFIRRGKIPKGIYCDDDPMAYGLISAFSQAGIRIPQDVRIVAIGMGIPELGRYSVPPLTVVELPLEEMAAASVPLMIKLIERKIDRPQYISFESKLYVRESC